jgi:ornithine cyclodeaminase
MASAGASSTDTTPDAARAIDDDVLILGAGTVDALLAGQERRIVDLVRQTLLAHHRQQTSTPESTFLRFPDSAENRIIAKAARADVDGAIAGLKWVSSFPANIRRGLDRCAAVLILNAADTGRPLAIMEGTRINYQRTAACAAVAAATLERTRDRGTIGIVGCGQVNFEQVRFLKTLFPEERDIRLFDRDPPRADAFRRRCDSELGDLTVTIASDLASVLAGCDLISFATTAVEPHVAALDACVPGTLVLHTSLRDLGVDAILAADNVVDDIDHVCAAQTSIHRAEQHVGHRRFIRATLGGLLAGDAAPRSATTPVTIFSPFGLAPLDLVVGRLVLEEAVRTGDGRAATPFLQGAAPRRDGTWANA